MADAITKEAWEQLRKASSGDARDLLLLDLDERLKAFEAERDAQLAGHRARMKKSRP